MFNNNPKRHNNRSCGNSDQYNKNEQNYHNQANNPQVSSTFTDGLRRAKEDTKLAVQQKQELAETSTHSAEEDAGLNQDKDIEKLIRSLEYADRFVSKNYLDNLGEYEVIDTEEKLDPNDKRKFQIGDVRIIKVTSLMLDKDEDMNEKLTSIY